MRDVVSRRRACRGADGSRGTGKDEVARRLRKRGSRGGPLSGAALEACVAATWPFPRARPKLAQRAAGGLRRSTMRQCVASDGAGAGRGPGVPWREYPRRADSVWLRASRRVVAAFVQPSRPSCARGTGAARLARPRQAPRRQAACAAVPRMVALETSTPHSPPASRNRHNNLHHPPPGAWSLSPYRPPPGAACRAAPPPPAATLLLRMPPALAPAPC